MNVRMTIDVPTHHLPALERTLGRQGLAIRPYIKHGVQRWMLTANHDHKPAIPETLVATPEDAPALRCAPYGSYLDMLDATMGGEGSK